MNLPAFANISPFTAIVLRPRMQNGTVSRQQFRVLIQRHQNYPASVHFRQIQSQVNAFSLRIERRGMKVARNENIIPYTESIPESRIVTVASEARNRRTEGRMKSRTDLRIPLCALSNVTDKLLLPPVLLYYCKKRTHRFLDSGTNNRPSCTRYSASAIRTLSTGRSTSTCTE
jgi:hypothetical protein